MYVGRDFLPKEYAKSKENEKKIVQRYKELSGTSDLDAKSKYVHMCRGLKTYGVTFFLVKVTPPIRQLSLQNRSNLERVQTTEGIKIHEKKVERDGERADAAEHKVYPSPIYVPLVPLSLTEPNLDGAKVGPW
ncbi:hypothetical protein ANCCEY_11744 [Ancylostoma ceylanicum]|uniref:FERM domain-containing protein n=1 Tax=Ancylostoma ceylanicum TaxID=53326 RepID=A0A0D6LGU7_9BILA|nr:hypothetical protein ANCCEY_11744 [Ancylostoma ceylanicum]